MWGRRKLSYVCETVMTGRHWYSAHYDPTVKDSPHPHASLILGFLNANFALQTCTVHQQKKRICGRKSIKDAPQPVLLPVHLAPDDREQRLAVDDDLDPVLLHHLVELRWVLDVLEVVRQARAALVPHAYADHLRGRALEEVLQPLDRGGCLTIQRDREQGSGSGSAKKLEGGLE